ncbi:hypothetical protein Goarm_011061 [Gossypium armourianum]|uniref:Uncharacterized protein n=1 Tax=Gossypium armourianum TaxID=34283 RepID=A0A7J9IVM7_9ROSI|nr:hypothetical protein [Gossypium armourianum]
MLLSVKVVRVMEVVKRGLMLLSVNVVRVKDVMRRGLGKWRGKPLMRMKVKALKSSLRLRCMKKSIVND